jgi:asparagine synthetase B (glutamine-hydrolysing)
MSGLFGIARLNCDEPSNFAEVEMLFEQMGRRLHHSPEYRIDKWSDPAANLIVGRVGLPSVNLVPWPTTAARPGAVQAFFSGVLHQENLGHELAELPNAAMLRQFSGFFAAVFHGGQPGTTILAADRRASVPIFYAQSDDLLIFASEVKALLACPQVRREIDLEALSTFLVSGHLMGDQTHFRSIRRLRGGEVLRIQDRQLTKAVYWRFAPGSAADKTPEWELQEELGRLVSLASARNLGDLNTTMLFLSGGADSRGILGGVLASLCGDGSRLNTVCWGSEKGSSSSDAAVAAAIASSFGLKHRFMRRTVDNYRENFTKVNFLIDGLSDIAAFHPYEYQIMEELRAAGFSRVLRGDEVFGWSYSARGMDTALALVRLRRLRDAVGISDYIRPERFQELCAASDEIIDSILKEVYVGNSNDAKDYLYFSHRLQCYLNTASYYKQLVLDQRNVLLDETILDFMAHVPAHLRVNKILFHEAMARAYPELWRIPLSQKNNLENWFQLLSSNTPVQAFAIEELEDTTSGIWEYFDRKALRELLASFARPVPLGQNSRRSWSQLSRSFLADIFYAMPAPIVSAIQRAADVPASLSGASGAVAAACLSVEKLARHLCG